MTLDIRFWGTRGSIPSPGPHTVRHGGNTSCVEVRCPDGRLVVLDAGTGIRALGRAMLAERADAPLGADIYITHAHWDHIQGLPFFAPLFEPAHRFRIWTSAAQRARIEHAVRTQMAPDVFPIPFEEMRAAVEFRALDEADAPHCVRVDAFPVRHPGGALAFRLRHEGDDEGSLVFAPDNELGDEAPYDVPADWRERFVGFVRGASLLVHDAMFGADEIAAFRGWGHSAAEETVALAIEAGVPRLALFHHHPERDDEAVDRLVSRARDHAARLGGAVEIFAASEGARVTV